jgi:CRP-like cAMP-binding protein
MKHVHFIENGLVSVSTKTAREQWVEAWLIGSEGMTGIPVLLGDDDDPPFRRVVQVPGSAYRISRDDLKRALAASQGLRSLLLRYVQVVLVQTSQSGACNAHHELKERLSRWLLLARDALDDDEMPLTHRMLARLLGVRRASVTECLGKLEAAGSIENSRGLIQVTDANKLATLSCDCHRLIRTEYERLIGQERSSC